MKQQREELQDLFRYAMLDWDVAVKVKRGCEPEYADVSFELWATKFEMEFAWNKLDECWQTIDDCQRQIYDCEDVWIQIAANLHDRLTP